MSTSPSTHSTSSVVAQPTGFSDTRATGSRQRPVTAFSASYTMHGRLVVGCAHGSNKCGVLFPGRVLNSPCAPPGPRA
eukprot:363504-Chlamydomonas_euryale.AAC.10